MEFEDNKPIYLQLADRLMDDVERDPSLCGGRVPSVREFAANVGVNANTVMRTYTWLQQEGIIYNQRGIGYFYTEDVSDKVRRMRRQVFFDKEMAYFMERLSIMGVTPEELSRYYSEYLANK